MGAPRRRVGRWLGSVVDGAFDGTVKPSPSASGYGLLAFACWSGPRAGGCSTRPAIAVLPVLDA